LLQTNQSAQRALIELQQIAGNLFQPGGHPVGMPRAQGAERAQDDEVERDLQDLDT
jgi:hypothetical protein